MLKQRRVDEQKKTLSTRTTWEKERRPASPRQEQSVAGVSGKIEIHEKVPKRRGRVPETCVTPERDALFFFVRLVRGTKEEEKEKRAYQCQQARPCFEICERSKESAEQWQGRGKGGEGENMHSLFGKLKLHVDGGRKSQGTAPHGQRIPKENGRVQVLRGGSL